jgi:hypothetical protein
MKLYQLFKSVPSATFLASFLACYGLKGLDDASEFSKHTLREKGTIERLYDILPEMVLYYIPCKAKKYLSDLNEDRAITILRQFLRLYEYELFKKERVIQKKKLIFYSLQPMNIRPIFIQKVHDVIDLT